MWIHARWLILALSLWLPVSQAAALCCPMSAMQHVHQAVDHAEHCAQETDASEKQTVDLGCITACAASGHGLVVTLTSIAPADLHDRRLPVWPTASLLSAHDSPLLRPPIDFS